MTKKEFNQRVSEMCAYVKQYECDNMRNELVQRNISDPFSYGAWCEYNFEANLRGDYKRKTTYTNDFSLAEWCVPVEGMQAIASTLRNALQNWRDSIEFFASAKPLPWIYPKRWAEPFAFKVEDTTRFFKAIEQTIELDKQGMFKRQPVSWELWQVIKGTPLNKVDYTNYTVINDYTCDIDEPEEVEIFNNILRS